MIRIRSTVLPLLQNCFKAWGFVQVDCECATIITGEFEDGYLCYHFHGIRSPIVVSMVVNGTTGKKSHFSPLEP
jgi:hypothetical protein